MKSLRLFFLQLAAAAIVSGMMTGCGGSGSSGGGGNNTQPISVAFAAQPPSSLVSSGTTSVTANVANDSASKGVNWTVTCGSSSCGSFNPAQTASGGATTFTAPTAVPTGNTVTITATSVADSTKSASATITIGAAISVTFAAQPPSSLVTAATTSITANVANDSANGGVKWTVTCGSSACGSFSSAQTASGTATTFTAPSAIPTGNTVTVTATSVTDSTKSASATITITAPLVIAVTFAAQPPSSLAPAGTINITANVTNDSANAGVKWTVTCSSSQCGSFNPTSTASGAATAFTAPPVTPTGSTITVTATSVTDTTKSASATITILGQPITVSLTPQPPTSLVANSTTGITAIVANDSVSGGVKWTVTCGSSACGSFNPAQTASGGGTIFLAPSAVPTGNTVKVTATSVSDATKSASATITITAVNGSPLSDGTYVYHLAGQDGNGQCFFAGAFTVANGSITGGEQDFTDSNVAYSNSLTATGSSISYATGGNIQVVLATANTNIGVNGVITLRGAKTSGTRVLVSEFDTFATGSGSIDLQTSQAAPSGGYAFLIAGVGFDSSTPPQALATTLGGVLNISGTTISLTTSVFDVNFGGNNRSNRVFTAGSVSAPDSFGRISIGLTPDPAIGLADFILTGYIIGPNQIQLIESQQDNLGFNLAGMALGQGSNTGNFSAANLSGKTYVFGSGGVDGNGILNLAGTFAFGANSALTGSMAVNDTSAVGVNTITGGSYTVDPKGRVTITGVTLSPLTDTLAFQAYLDGNGNAMVMGADTVQVSAGPAYVQTTATPTLFGPYGLTAMGFTIDQNNNQNPWSAAGPVTINSGSYSGFTDYNNAGSPVAAQALSGATNSSTGVISLTGLNALSFASANSFVNYTVDANRMVSISIDSGLLSLGTLESVKQ